MSSRILVVDDEADLLALVEYNLQQGGYAVATAKDGASALAEVKRQRPDLIVLDVQLPDVLGTDVCKRLRRDPDTRAIPILMLTARGEEIDRVVGFELGADDYVVKPFDLPELLARLRALIRRSANEARSRIKIGEILIDTAARSVTRRGEDVALTAREYALLEYLALHRGEVVTRTALYEHLFDENDSTLSNLLDVHVSNVRKKLGCEFIATRRGHGYGIGL